MRVREMRDVFMEAFDAALEAGHDPFLSSKMASDACDKPCSVCGRSDWTRTFNTGRLVRAHHTVPHVLGNKHKEK